jgi:hypothetical protein
MKKRLARPHLPGRTAAAKNHAVRQANAEQPHKAGWYLSQLAAIRRGIDFKFRRYQRQLQRLKLERAYRG